MYWTFFMTGPETTGSLYLLANPSSMMVEDDPVSKIASTLMYCFATLI